MFDFSIKWYEGVVIFWCILCEVTFLWRLWPWNKSHILCGDREFGRNPSRSIFMEEPALVFIFTELPNLFFLPQLDWKLLHLLDPKYNPDLKCPDFDNSNLSKSGWEQVLIMEIFIQLCPSVDASVRNAVFSELTHYVVFFWLFALS